MKGVPRVPKKNPKHQAQLQRQQVLTKRGKTVRNWKKIGLIVAVCAGIVIFVTWGIIAFTPTGRAVKAGDTVYIYYELRLSDNSLKDKSQTAAGTSFTMKTGTGGVIPGFYDNVLGMREGETKSFKIPACPSMDCDPYGGYTTGELAWQELNFYVKIVRFA